MNSQNILLYSTFLHQILYEDALIRKVSPPTELIPDITENVIMNETPKPDSSPASPDSYHKAPTHTVDLIKVQILS